MAGLAAILLMLLPSGEPAEPRWYFSEEKAFAVAQERQVPIMVDVYDDQSRFSRWYDDFVFNDPKVARRFDRFVPLRLPAREAGRNFVKLYPGKTQPVVLFLRPDGAPFWRIVGRISPDFFARQMDRAIERLNIAPRVSEVMATKAGTVEELAEAAMLASVGQKIDEAVELLRLAEERSGSAESICEASLCIADSLRIESRFDEAFRFYEASSRSESPFIAARSLFGVASIQVRRDQFDLASASLRKILRIRQAASGDVMMAQRMLMRIGTRTILPNALVASVR